MLKIYIGPANRNTVNDDFTNPTLWNHQHQVFIDWQENKNNFIYVDELKNSDVVFMLSGNHLTKLQISFLKEYKYTNQLLVVCNLFHCDEDLGLLYERENIDSIPNIFRKFSNNKVLFLDQNLKYKNYYGKHNDVLFYDLLFERQIVYHTQYNKFDLSDRVFSKKTSGLMYELTDINKNINSKHYLAPMRDYPEEKIFRGSLRRKLRTLLDPSKGYVSDLSNGIFLEPQETSFSTFYTHKIDNYAGGTWWPVHNKYYNDSIVSMYVETITKGLDYRVVTEKTYDPLIKGNFILPYAYQGFLNDVTSYGFMLPDWIDYSYDVLPDELRWESYKQSVQKILDMDQKTLYNLYERDKHILEHNRQIFYDSPRISLIEKIQEYYNKF
jgi:hypothetical protein